jgi:myosin-5
MSHTTALQAVEVYTTGTKAWFTDEEQAWVSATCASNEIANDSVKLVFQGDANQKVMLTEW